MRINLQLNTNPEVPKVLAYVDLTITANDLVPGGTCEATITGFRVNDKEGGRPWVSRPSREYKTKSGEKKYSPIFSCAQDAWSHLEKAILARYDQVKAEAASQGTGAANG